MSWKESKVRLLPPPQALNPQDPKQQSADRKPDIQDLFLLASQATALRNTPLSSSASELPTSQQCLLRVQTLFQWQALVPICSRPRWITLEQASKLNPWYYPPPRLQQIMCLWIVQWCLPHLHLHPDPRHLQGFRPQVVIPAIVTLPIIVQIYQTTRQLPTTANNPAAVFRQHC